VIKSNVENYTVEFFAPATAQKRVEQCQEMQCIITDVSPFEYNIQVLKKDYKTQNISTKIQARKSQEFVFELEKEARLEPIEISVKEAESAKQKIARLREESRFIASFQLDTDQKVTFSEQGERMDFEYRNAEKVTKIADFALEDASKIFAEYITGTQKVFFRIATS
jgi:hypothetical protein